MHVVILNGSPRIRKYSNTDKIIEQFGKGLQEAGADYELHTLSNRKEWDAARDAFLAADRIILATPLFVECLPSFLLEFLESLPAERQKPAELSFILHSGFDEGHQLRLGERFLASLPEQLGCTYGGCLVKGGSFTIRLFEGEEREKMVKPYVEMGRLYALKGNFLTPEAAKFTGPERHPWLVQKLVGFILKKVLFKKFDAFAKEWGCTRPLTDKVY